MTGMMKTTSGESMGGMFGGTPIYEPLDVGAALTAGASWGTAVPDTMEVSSKGTAGKTIASNGLPLGVPSSSTGGLSAPQVRSTPQLSSPPLLTSTLLASSPHLHSSSLFISLSSPSHLLPPPTSSQSAEVAAAAAASVSLQVSVRKAAVATVKASSGVTFKFEAAGERSALNMEELKAALAAKLGVNASDLTLDAKDPPPATADAAAADTDDAADDDAADAAADRRRRSRRRMSTGGSVSLKAYVATNEKQAMLTSMKSVASDTAALSAALNISVLGATPPELLQVMLSSSPPLLFSSSPLLLFSSFPLFLLSSSPLLVLSSHLYWSPPPLLSPCR